MKAPKQRKAQQSRKDAILVLGMHRSGTSLLGGILDGLGCKGPRTELEVNDENPMGYFESKPIVSLNDEILKTAGTRWNDWQPLREGWLDSPRFNEFRIRAVEIVRAEYGDSSMIYLKDPRICRLLPFWRDVFEGMGFRILCIHTHRHPVDVATSMKARENAVVEPSLGMLCWLRHVLEAEATSRGLPRIFTSYASLVSDWQGFADRTEEAFGFVWPALRRTARKRVADFVDPSLQNHESSIETFLRDPLVPEPFRDTLRVMENWAQNGEDDDERTTLDRLHRDFDLSAPLLFAPINALVASTLEVKSLKGAKTVNEAHRADLEALAVKLADTQGQNGQLSSQKEQLRAELHQSHTDLEEAQDQACKREADLEALAVKLADAAEREIEMTMEVTAWTDRLIDRDKKFFKLQQEADQNRAVLAAKIAEIAARSAELDDIRNLHIHETNNLHSIYRSSTSWKATAPLRSLGKLLAGLGMKRG